MDKRRQKNHERAARLNIPLKEGVIGRHNQKTVRGPNGQLMSMSAAAKMAGLPIRTVIGRIQNGLDEKLWYHPGNLKRKVPVKKARVIVAVLTGRKNRPNGPDATRKERHKNVQRRRRARLKAARLAGNAGPGPVAS